MKNMPRKPLMSSGESHRVNFRATDEVKDILNKGWIQELDGGTPAPGVCLQRQ